MTRSRPTSLGRFISFEGIDGSGKSTQIRALAHALQSLGHETVLTREPGGSPGAEEIRHLVLNGQGDRWSPETELLLFTAARRDHLERTILPALQAGKIVLCDRFADSTRIYQGEARADMRALVDQLHALMIAREPDMTVLIDIDAETSLARAMGRGGDETRFESFGLDMQKRMRTGFLALAQSAPERFLVVDGAQDPEALSAHILKEVRAWLA